MIRSIYSMACLILIVSAAAMQCAAAELPNIVIVYADDLGYGDLSCCNPKAAYKTPRLDRMAQEGIRSTDAHSPSTICSPSRYGLFSGQQIYRSTGRGGGAFEGPGGPSYLKPGTLTLGDMLKELGYRTGVFRKWHVGLTWLDKEWRGSPTEPDWWPRLAVREGDWKLAMTYDARRVELHQLINDRAEAKDSSKEHPEIVARLSKLALDWKATLPEKPNPDCISKEAQQPTRKKQPVDAKSE